jgi:thioredoxin reductase (NADPH)
MGSEAREHTPDGNDNTFDIVIIGAGPAGLFGTFYAGMRNMRTLLMDTLPEMGGQLAVLYPEKYIYDVPGFPKILAKDLVQNLVEQASQFNPAIRLGEQVTDLRYLDGDKKRILEVETDCCTYQTRSVLIAAGVGAFAPNKLNVPGLELFEDRGVHYFVKDKSVFEGKRLLIVGGGDSAVDWALHLHPVASHVTLIHRRDQFRAHESSVNELRESPVDIKLFYELESIHGSDMVERATIVHNKTRQTEELAVDAVLMNLGFKADLGPIKEWGLSIEKRSIPVGPDQSTTMPGVYAAGDIAGSTVKLDLIAVGFAQAAIAVNSAKAFIDPTAKVFPGHSSDIGTKK